MKPGGRGNILREKTQIFFLDKNGKFKGRKITNLREKTQISSDITVIYLREKHSEKLCILVKKPHLLNFIFDFILK